MVKLLLKNRFARLFASLLGKGKSGNRKPSVPKIVLIAVLALYCVGVFALLSTLAAISFGGVMIAAGADWLYFALFSLATLSILFVLSIFETKSELFECSDNELLLSMPIPPHSVVLSRILTVLLFNYLGQALIMLPAIIVYAVLAKNIIGVIGGIVISLLIPIVATSLAAAVGYLLALISRRMPKKTLVTVVMAFAFLALYMFGYSKLVDNLDRFAEYIANNAGEFISMVPALYHIGAVALLKPVHVALAVALTVAVATLFYLVISKNYIKVVTQTQNADRAKYKAVIIKKKSPFYALVRKEIGRVFSSAIYIINSMMGAFMVLAIGIYAIIKRDFIRETALLLSSTLGLAANSALCVAVTAVLIAISSTNTAAASALSLEGKSLWCIKTIPAKANTVLLAKAMPQIIISLPASIAAGIMFIVAADLHYAYWPIVIITAAISSTAYAFFGILINVLIPKFDFENEAQVVKNSGAVAIVIFTQMLLSLGVAVLSLMCVYWDVALLGILLPAIIFFALGAICISLLLTVGVKRFDSFSV